MLAPYQAFTFPPVTAKFLTSGAGTDPVSPVERAGTVAAVVPHWLFQWLALSLFPASALVVMTRRRTREDFDAAAVAAAAAPDDGGEEPEPFF